MDFSTAYLALLVITPVAGFAFGFWYEKKRRPR